MAVEARPCFTEPNEHHRKDRSAYGETSYRGSGRLAGRKALITGGDSGMGRAAAIAYAREGGTYIDRLRTGAPLAEAPKQYWNGGGSVGYADWPGTNGQEQNPGAVG